MNKITTLGYVHKDAGAMLNTLTAQGYHILDIRLKPFSQKPGFNKEDLAAEYKRVYHHIPDLGNLNYKSSSQYIAIKNWEQGLQQLKRALDRAPLVLMCACQWVETCHRFYVARLAQEAIPGLKIEHLLQAGHAGMLKHLNAVTSGQCSWVENGRQCEATAQGGLCKRCQKPTCEKHTRVVWHWEKQIFYCPDCHEVHLTTTNLY